MKRPAPIEIPLLNLKPRWVEFTSKAGVLRCLQPNDPKTRAQGLVFDCPRCRHDKNKQHYCIFLFDKPGVAPEARPRPRFRPSWVPDVLLNDPAPEDFHKLSLWSLFEGRIATAWLRPGDLKCRWEGTLKNGVVSWSPSLWERLRRKF